MTYFWSDSFSTNDVIGALAAATIHDLHVNNFAFTGFPAIEVSEEAGSFVARFRLGTNVSSPLELSFSDGKALTKAFRAKRQLSAPWVQKVQDLILDLETKAAN